MATSNKNQKLFRNFRSWSELKKIASEFLAGFMKHDLMTLAAALAFYTALSLAPLLIIVLAVVSLLGDAAQSQFLAQVQGLMGGEAADAISAIIKNGEERPEIGSIAGIFGVVVLMFSASTVFAQLQSSLNVIWDVEAEASDSGVWSWIRKRLLSMGLVLSFGFLALVSLVVSSATAYLFDGEGAAWGVVNFVASFAIFSAMFSLILKYLPDIQLPWRAAAVGGILTAALFTVGKSLIGLYLGSSAIGSSYGAAGSLIVLLAWVYYSAIIVFAGAELTRSLTVHDDASSAKSVRSVGKAHEASVIRA